MHCWGDDWFKQHGSNLYAAIREIENGLRKHHIRVCGKEKWGCYRDEYLTFWDGGLYSLIFSSAFVRPVYHYKTKWLRNFIQALHDILAFRIDKYVIKPLTSASGLKNAIVEHQCKMYNKVFQQVCAKYPDVTDELICDIDGYKLIKPCKWGSIDGEAIHSKYWR